MRNTRTVFSAILILFGFLQILSCQKNATDPEQKVESPATGLLLLPPEQYNAIPIAAPPVSGPLPVTVDLSSKMPVAGDQGQRGSCTAWAVGYALKTYQEKVERQWSLEQADHLFSPAFIYNQISNNCNGGTFIMDALNLLHEQGCASLSTMPYSVTDCSMPNSSARAEAAQYAIHTWARANQADQLSIKEHLAGGFPVILALETDEYFRRSIITPTNPVWQSNTSKITSYHAVCAVGYNDNTQVFKVFNSWGESFGENGYFYIPYDHFSRRCREAYVAYDKTSTYDNTGNIAHLNFGTVHNHKSAQRTFSLINNSTAPVTLHFEATSGRIGPHVVPRCVCFSVDPWEDIVLQPGTVKAITVYFSVSVGTLSACCPGGLQTATLTVKYSNGNVFGTVTMEGLGVL